MAERSLRQTLKLGNYRGAMTEHQLSSFNPSRNTHQTTSSFGCSLGQDAVILNKNHGVLAHKQEVTTVTKGLPNHIQPIGMNFSVSTLVSSPSRASHRVQRRE